MGMFDDVRCLYPLPWEGAADFPWQSKDTDAQYLDQYEIRADGTLWHETYTLRHEADEKAPLGFWQHRENVEWEQEHHVGELEIHHLTDKAWYSVRFWFKDGKVADLICKKRDK